MVLYVQQGAIGGYIGSFQIPIAGCRSDVLRYRALGADGQLIDGSLHRS